MGADVRLKTSTWRLEPHPPLGAPRANRRHRRSRRSSSCATARPRRPARCCPAGRRACTSPTPGGQQAERRGRADRRARQRSTPSTPRRSSGPARPPRRSPRPRGLRAAGRHGPARVRLRRVDRRRAEEADEAARVGHRAAGAVDVPLPGRRELHRDAAPHRRRRSTACAPPTRAARSCACRTPTRSRPPSPTPSAPTSTCSSASSSRRARSASIVVRHRRPGRARRQLHRRLARRSCGRRERR